MSHTSALQAVAEIRLEVVRPPLGLRLPRTYFVRPGTPRLALAARRAARPTYIRKIASTLDSSLRRVTSSETSSQGLAS